MKLRKEPGSEGRKRALKSAEVVGRAEPSEPGLEFNARKVVGRKIWQRVDGCLNAQSGWGSTDELPFLRLIAFDPERRLQAEQNNELPGEIQRTIFEIARHEVDPDIAVNAELARYVDLFPQVMDGLDEPLAPTPHDLDKSLTSFDGFSSIDHDIELLAPRMRALIQLFPEQKERIFQKIEQLQFWDKALKGVQDRIRFPGETWVHLPAILANLAVMFPDRQEDLLEIIRPLWSQLRDRLTSWGNQLDIELDDPDPDAWPRRRLVTAYVDNILGMTFLAEVSQRKSLHTSSKLPERLIA